MHGYVRAPHVGYFPTPNSQRGSLIREKIHGNLAQIRILRIAKKGRFSWEIPNSKFKYGMFRIQRNTCRKWNAFSTFEKGVGGKKGPFPEPLCI